MVQSEIAENVANRLVGWGKILGVLIGIPLGIVTVFLSINLRDLSKVAEKARTDVEAQINSARGQADKLKADTQVLQKQLDDARPQLDRLGAMQAEVNNKLAILKTNVEGQLASIVTKVEDVEKQIGGCASDLNSCPVFGCADKDSPQGIQNELKRRIPRQPAHPVTFADFRSLQDEASRLVGQGKPLTQVERATLKNLNTAQGRVAEGDAVRVVGYLVGNPRVEGKEAVNCRLNGVANSDFHVSLAPAPSDTEFSGIVIEMIPQNRPPGWTIEKLRKVMQASRQVMVVGQLFYDNSHRVNGDSNNPTQGPKRFTVWEVHPVTSLTVCLRDRCNPEQMGQWTALESAP
jgi:uncharacterized protein YoxC